MFNLFRKKEKKYTASQVRRAFAYYDATRRGYGQPFPPLDRGQEENSFLETDRIKAIAIGRDQHRNKVKFAAFERQISIMVAGRVRLQATTPSEAWNRSAEFVFNSTFGRDVLYRKPRVPLAALCKQIVTAVIREGDILVAFDGGRFGDTGKLLVYEADQLCMMDEVDFSAAFPGYFQRDGVVVDAVGRVAGYIVSAVHAADVVKLNRKNGLSSYPASECLFFGTDEAVLVSSCYRAEQLRGVPPVMPIVSTLANAESLTQSELMTALKCAKVFATVTTGAATTAAMEEVDIIKALDALDAGTPAQTAGRERMHYEALDKNAFAITNYLAEGDNLTINDSPRPNLDTYSFKRDLCAEAGSVLGLTRGYEEQAVSNSYTAHRGESLMTWASMYDYQNELKAQFLDWLAECVLNRAIRRGELPTFDYSGLIEWELPTMPAIDERTSVEAQASAIKAGLATYSEVLGAGWQDKLRRLADEVKLIHSLGLHLSFDETRSGGVVGGGTAQGNNRNEVE